MAQPVLPFDSPWYNGTSNSTLVQPVATNSDPAQIPYPETVREPIDPFAPTQSSPGWRKLVRETSFTANWLAGGGSHGLGISELKARTSVVVPFPVFGSPLIVSPNIGVSFVDPSAEFLVPDKLCRASLGIMWRKPISDRLTTMIGVTPESASDMEATKNAVRVTGLGMATYDWTPETKVTLGVVYLNRSDINVLPIAGLIWTPNETTRLDLTFPRPRISKRVSWFDAPFRNTEDWIYLAGQLGGGTYAVERPLGFDDEMTFRDFRFILGMERKTDSGIKGFAEIGYVFGRKVEFDIDTADYSPDDTLMLGVGCSF